MIDWQKELTDYARGRPALGRPQLLSDPQCRYDIYFKGLTVYNTY